jgi:VanZ family protein
MGKRRLLYAAPAAAWFLLILILSFLPGKSLPSFTLLNWDKLGHFLLYAIWILLLRFSMAGGMRRLKLRMFLALLFALICGTAIEFAQQAFTADRQFDFYDVLANAVGALAAWLLLQPFRKESAVA